MEELTDILVGLEQRISAYKNRLQELEKKRRRLDDEIATIKKYLELAETLYRVEGAGIAPNWNGSAGSLLCRGRPVRWILGSDTEPMGHGGRSRHPPRSRWQSDGLQRCSSLDLRARIGGK